MGYSNVLLLNNVGTILEAMKHITPELSRLRTVLPHRDYELPPTGVGMDPRGATPTEVTEALLRHDALPLGRALSRAYDGVSRILADEIGYRAGIDVERTVSALTPRAAAGREAVAEVMDAIRSRWSPVIFEGQKVLTLRLPLAHLSRESEVRPVPRSANGSRATPRAGRARRSGVKAGRGDQCHSVCARSRRQSARRASEQADRDRPMRPAAALKPWPRPPRFVWAG